MKVERIDHLVLTVRDIKATCKFYGDILGMEVITFNHGRLALKFGNQKLNLREISNSFSPKALKPIPGAIDICFITSDPITIIIEHFKANQVKIVEGPVKRTGAIGSIVSVYVRDPDGNLIEISNYDSNSSDESSF